MSERRAIHGALLLGVLLALGCGAKTAPPPEGGSTSVYRVGAPDVLYVVVLPDPTLEREVVVRPDGMITLDLIGDVRAAGRSVDEIAADIQKRMTRYKRDANVTVRLVGLQSTSITVFGEVRKPAAFPLTKETRAAEAIGMVGGETIFASSGKIRVIRSGGGETSVYVVDLGAIRSGDLRTNIVLASGDIVYVPPNVFAKIGYALNSLLLPFQPLLGFANSVGGTALAP